MQFRKWYIYVVLCVILGSIFVSRLLIAQHPITVFEDPVPVMTSKIDSLANGETTEIKIWWTKPVKDFTVDNLEVFTTDDDYNPLDLSLSTYPRFKLPFLSNFRSVSRKKFFVDVTAPFNYGGPIITGKLIVHLKQDALKKGNEETNHVFDFGKKAHCWLTPSRIYVVNDKTMPIALFWDQNVSGVDLDDLRTYKGAKLSDFRGNTSNQRVTLRAPRKGSGWIRVVLRKNACDQGNNKESISVRYGPPL